MNDNFVRYSAGEIERYREHLFMVNDTTIHPGFSPERLKKKTKNLSTAGDSTDTQTALFPMKMQKCYTPEPILSVRDVKSHTTLGCSVHNTVSGLDLFWGMRVVIIGNVSILSFAYRINLTQI